MSERRFPVTILTVFVILSGLISCTSSKTDMVSLFNGKDLTGWEIKAKPDDLKKDYWKTVNGYIEANSLANPEHDYVWLMSEKEYLNFELTFKFQSFRDSPGNSGIQVRSRYNNTEYWLDGPQIDIHPPGYWRTGMMWDETKGNQHWIYPDIPDDKWVYEDMVTIIPPFYFSDDENPWNEMRVLVDGMSIKAWLNEIMVTDYNGEGILNDSLHVAKNVGISGHIAFQIHSGDALKIRYKEIYIREL